MGWHADTEPDEAFDELDDFDESDRGGWLKWVAIGLAAWIVISLIVLVGMLKYKGNVLTSTASERLPGSQQDTPTASASAPTSPAGALPDNSNYSATARPTAMATFGAPGSDDLPIGWTVQASDQQSDCSAHSYGEVRTYFAQTPCVSLQRWLATTTVRGRKAVISWSIVRMADSETANQFLALVSRDGTGDINDLLREGKRFEDLPRTMPPAAFTSNYYGDTVHIAEAAWATGTSSDTDRDLQALSDQASVLH